MSNRRNNGMKFMMRSKRRFLKIKPQGDDLVRWKYQRYMADLSRLCAIVR